MARLTKAQQATRDAEIIRLYIAGVSKADIAHSYKITHDRVTLIIEAALKGAESRRGDGSDHLFELHYERLETLLRAHWAPSLDVKSDPERAARSARIVLEILERERALDELKAAEKPTGDRIDELARRRAARRAGSAKGQARARS